MSTPEPRCPRCTGPLGGSLARSRMTHARDLGICSPCATDEAMREVAGQAPIPPTDWPRRPART